MPPMGPSDDMDEPPMPPTNGPEGDGPMNGLDSMEGSPEGDEPMGGPNGMGDGSEDGGSMDGPNEMENGPEGDEPMNGPDNSSESEIDDIFNQLNTEDQAAVIKYAKSMAKDNSERLPESKHSNLHRMINEIVNDVMNSQDDNLDKKDKIIRNKKAPSPFVSQY